MLEIDAAPDDDPDFIELVVRLINGALSVHELNDVKIFKIDNWFDHKWLQFSGQVLPQLGVWKPEITPPPFVANRIVQQWHSSRIERGPFELRKPGPDIHFRGASCANYWRRLERIAPDSALFWFSGNTLATGRGSLMGYLPIEQEYWTWFLAMVRDGNWKIRRRKNIHEYEVRSFERAAFDRHSSEAR